MKKHAVYLTVDELTDIIIAYDGSITLLKQNRRKMKESAFIKEKFSHMPKMYTDAIEKEQRMMEKLIKIRNELKNKEETNMTNEQKRWNALPDIDNETVKIWLEELGNPTAEEIKAEIEEVRVAISNEHLWELGYDGKEPLNPHTENIEVLMEYLEVLEEMLEEKEELI